MILVVLMILSDFSSLFLHQKLYFLIKENKKWSGGTSADRWMDLRLMDGWISVDRWMDLRLMGGPQVDGWTSVDRWMDLRLIDVSQWMDGWISMDR